MLILAGCSGSDFAPQPGPFSAAFVSGEAELGTFTFTVTDGLIGGTGTLTHEGAPVNVSIAAVITDKTISGQVTNATVGAGEFTGTFTSRERALGTFNFLGTVDQQTTSGTWEAIVD